MKPSETLKPLMRAHTRVMVIQSLQNPETLNPYIYNYIDIYRGLRRVFRFCGVFVRVLQIIYYLLPIHKL